MEVRLKVLVGANSGQELLIPGPKFFIGRAEDCQLRPRSDLISRHHCVILLEDNYLAVRDFGSKNGTHVNDEPVVGERELLAGDRLKVGPLEFEICIGAPAAPKKRPKVESIKEAATRTAETGPKDQDVSQWLAPTEKDAGAAETRAIMANETSEMDLSPETVTRVGEPPEPEKPAERPSAGKKPGKLPAAPQKAAADSRNAAADVLNKFFKRR